LSVGAAVGTIGFIFAIRTVFKHAVAFPAAWDTRTVGARELIWRAAGSDISTAASVSAVIFGDIFANVVPLLVAAPAIVVTDATLAFGVGRTSRNISLIAATVLGRTFATICFAHNAAFIGTANTIATYGGRFAVAAVIAEFDTTEIGTPGTVITSAISDPVFGSAQTQTIGNVSLVACRPGLTSAGVETFILGQR
jgi:hypothetical protein